MALKYKISKADFDKLPADVQGEYVADGDDYKLDVSGLDDHPELGAAVRAKNHEKEKRQEAQNKLKEEQEAHTATKGEFDDYKKQTPDVAKLEGKWQKKVSDMEAKHETELKQRDGNINKLMVDNVADSIAREISKAPSLLKPAIAARLGVHYDAEGVASTKVLDADGEISATTLDELKNEFKTNNEYADIIIGSQGSGGGAQGSGQQGGGKPLEKPDFATASIKEIAAYNKSLEEGDA